MHSVSALVCTPATDPQHAATLNSGRDAAESRDPCSRLSGVSLIPAGHDAHPGLKRKCSEDEAPAGPLRAPVAPGHVAGQAAAVPHVLAEPNLCRSVLTLTRSGRSRRR